MAPSKGFVVRIAVYSAALLYLAVDVWWLHGPVHRYMHRSDPAGAEAVATAHAHGVVARVFHHPILVSQLDRAVAGRLHLEGRSRGDLGPAELRLVRYAALNDLIDHQILRVKTKAHALKVPVTTEEIDAELDRFAARFGSPEERAAALDAEGIAGETELRFRVAGRLQQQKYLESRIGPPCAVGEDEAREWIDAHPGALERPERVHARHLFLATRDRDLGEARATLEAALARIEAGEESFAAEAARLSEDPGTREAGGDLGWIARDRLPDDFTAAVFALPDRTPALVRTKHGWHMVEVLDRRPAGPVPADHALPAVQAALESERRQRAVQQFRTDLRAMERRNVHVYHDVIAALPATAVTPAER